MTFLTSLAIAVIFGSGAYLILQRDLLRMVVGILLISNAANLFVVASGLFRGRPPILPLAEGAVASDPLVQAMALTAIVISSSITALLFALVYRLYTSHRTIDLEEISAREVQEAEALERIETPTGSPERQEEPR